MAAINQLKLIKEGPLIWNRWRSKYPDANIKLKGADLQNVDLRGINLENANLNKANLKGSILLGANLKGATLKNADLTGANLKGTHLKRTNFERAKLVHALLSGSYLRKANLNEADFSGADLRCSSLVETNIESANLKGCKVFGLAAWCLNGKPADQTNLIITQVGEPEITVDDLKVAQFIYLLIDNKNVRSVIDTITSKAVLILGRFTPERKLVLDLIRENLNKRGYVPILFDFENTKNQTLMETVMTLAGMARFIIADITAATMVREELRSIVEKYPSKPVQPILLQGESTYVTLPEMFSNYRNILETYTYEDGNYILKAFADAIIDPAESWLEAKKSRLIGIHQTARERELENEIDLLKRKLQENNPVL